MSSLQQQSKLHVLRILLSVAFMSVVLTTAVHAAEHGTPWSDCSMCVAAQASVQLTAVDVRSTAPEYDEHFHPVSSTLALLAQHSHSAHTVRGPPAR